MFEDFAKKLVLLQIKNPMIFIVVFAIITLSLIPGIFLLVGNVEPSLEKVLPQEVQEIKSMNNMRNQFGADMMYLIVYTPMDPRSPDVLRYVNAIAQKLRTRGNILEVTTIADILISSSYEGEVVNEIPDSLNLIKDILRKNPQTPLFIPSDHSYTVIRIRADTGASAEIITKVINSIEYDLITLDIMNPGVTTQLTGFNAIDKATFDIIMSDFALITLVSMILISIVVFLTFGSLSRGMLPMIVVMTALLWTMGLAGYFNFTITVVTMVAAAMIMGLGIDFGIHLVHSFFSFRKKGLSSKESLTETMSELIRAMLGASLTTSAGFLALLFGVLPAMQNLGIILAIGILSTLIGSIFLLPVIVYLYDSKKSKKQNSKNKNVIVLTRRKRK